MTLRAVIDTNIIISGSFWKGPPHAVVRAIRDGQVIPLATAATLNELRTTLSREKFSEYAAKANQRIDEIIDTFSKISAIVEAAPVPGGIVRDPKDEMMLACAVGGKADCIVSGDQDLLTLGSYEGIPIWSVVHFLSQLAPPEGDSEE